LNHTLTAPADLEARIKRDLATLLYEQGTNGCVVILVTSAAAAFATTNMQPKAAVILWWALITGLAIYRIVHIRHWLQHVAGKEFDGERAIKRFTILSLMSGALFGVFPYIAYPNYEFLGRSMVILILAGLAGGATTVLAADRRLALSYISLLLIPPCLLALVRPEYNLQIMGVLGLLYWLILVMAIIRTSKFIYNAARLHHHNEELLSAIGEEKRLVETSNQKLQQAYAEINSVNTALEQKIQARTQALSILASIDDLTGLKNRHTFAKTLNTTITDAKERNEKFSIFFVDLDGFKEINDIRGHLVGDKVLKTIATRLRETVKNKDFLCRWGGDEFVLIIDESAPPVLDTISDRICQTIQQPINIDFDTVKITASVGIATYPAHGANTTELVNAADVAMYELKKGGKNGTMLFESAFLEKIRFEQHLLTGLSKAIEQNEFDLYYQPMSPCRNDAPIIFEGLIRWKFEGAFIPPVIFVPIAETCDTIFEMGNWIIIRACQDLRKNRLGVDSRVSINISVRQLLSRNFVNFIQQCLTDYRLESWRLQIEVTESVFANNLYQANIVLSQLRDMGITIALDDFGCGFSSLSYLQSLPIDTIKIDQSFVRQMDAGGEKIIEATLSIAEAFGCNVVAEGIESEQQKIRLEQMGVDYLQGFYIAKPTPYFEVDSCWKLEDGILKFS
jgi:diguanylate cyclase (GGDEF)-like protein